MYAYCDINTKNQGTGQEEDNQGTSWLLFKLGRNGYGGRIQEPGGLVKSNVGQRVTLPWYDAQVAIGSTCLVAVVPDEY